MSKQLFDFLTRLAENNDRTWFAANRAEYDSLRADWLTKIQRIINALAVNDPALRGVQASDCAYRIYRDTRFSHDKTPYKTYFSALISPTGRHCDRACYYVHIGADECAVYGGVWCPETPILKKLRRAIIDNIEEFREITEAPEVEDLYPGWYGRKLKTATTPTSTFFASRSSARSTVSTAISSTIPNGLKKLPPCFRCSNR